MCDHEHDWQRDTNHPSAAALLAFLEADLERGLRLAWQAEVAGRSANGLAPSLAAELEAIHAEILRWVTTARQRRIPMGRLQSRVDAFSVVVAELRGPGSVGGNGA